MVVAADDPPRISSRYGFKLCLVKKEHFSRAAIIISDAVLLPKIQCDAMLAHTFLSQLATTIHEVVAAKRGAGGRR